MAVKISKTNNNITMKKSLIRKIWKVIKESMFLRILIISNAIFVLFIIVSLSSSAILHGKTNDDLQKIEEDKITLASLERLAMIEASESIESTESGILIDKAFAGYDEVIPFIALLESLFSIIDQKADITIKSKENQIFLDHFADYTVNLEIDNNAELFFKAFDELYNSRFITRITSFALNYKTMETGGHNELKEAEFTIRLYLN
ncbi:hypothetical protein KKA95_03755 [Patescibacteria group bacterium]|nr:hypothetical protein [Patescibacteria group bacterium]